MLYRSLLGTLAGAAGTAALNIATYADMAIRGRAASSVPDKTAGALADKIGIDLSENGDGKDDDMAANRRTGLGALLGYVTGLGIGTLFGLLRPALSDVPRPLLGVAVGLAAMASSDAPAEAFGATDVSTWSWSDWGWDFAFHLLYGLATVFAYDALAANNTEV